MKKALLLFFALVTLSASAQISYLDSLKTYIDYEKVKPMVLVNSKAYKKPLSQLDSTKIKSFYILLGEAAIERFGREGRNGMIDIQLREESDSDSIMYMAIDTPAKFNGGGRVEFSNWVMRNVSYPDIALQSERGGIVIVAFAVNKDGTINDVKIDISTNMLFNDEALRVVKSSPPWTPASYKGNPLKIISTIPIQFMIPN